MPPAVDHGFRFSRDIDGHVFTLLASHMRLAGEVMGFASEPRLTLLDPGEPDGAFIIATLERLAGEWTNRRSGRTDMMEAYLVSALTLAARRGVQVDLIMPRRSNHRLADVARHRPLRDLAAAGARLWFTPFMLHAKVIVIDEQLALAGSANLDLRSLFLNYELMVAFYEPADVGRFAAWIESERSAAVRFEPTEPGLLRDLSEGLLLWLAFQL
jgi:hypothetical protein